MNDLISRVIDLAICIQQIPAPTFQEGERATYIKECFLAEGLKEVEIDQAGNVLACLKAGKTTGQSEKNPLIISAHMDSVFPIGTNLATRWEGEKLLGPGIGDNAIAVAGLFGLLWNLREKKISLSHDLWLIANTCEEGLGDLRGMKAIADRFRDNVSAYIILEGIGLGSVYHRGLGVRRYRIAAQTEGGHSWLDFGKPSAIHELTILASRLATLSLPETPRTTLNIGQIHGGTSVNTIAAEANLELDIRSEDSEILLQLVSEVEDICTGVEKDGVTIIMESIGNRPAGEIPASHPLVGMVVESLREHGIRSKLAIGSTDANIPLSQGAPAVTLCLTTGGRAHTVHEYINTNPLENGLEVVLDVVKKL